MTDRIQATDEELIFYMMRDLRVKDVETVQRGDRVLWIPYEGDHAHRFFGFVEHITPTSFVVRWWFANEDGENAVSYDRLYDWNSDRLLYCDRECNAS